MLREVHLGEGRDPLGHGAHRLRGIDRVQRDAVSSRDGGGADFRRRSRHSADLGRPARGRKGYPGGAYRQGNTIRVPLIAPPRALLTHVGAAHAFSSAALRARPPVYGRDAARRGCSRHRSRPGGAGVHEPRCAPVAACVVQFARRARCHPPHRPTPGPRRATSHSVVSRRTAVVQPSRPAGTGTDTNTD